MLTPYMIERRQWVQVVGLVQGVSGREVVYGHAAVHYTKVQLSSAADWRTSALWMATVLTARLLLCRCCCCCCCCCLVSPLQQVNQVTKLNAEEACPFVGESLRILRQEVRPWLVLQLLFVARARGGGAY